MRSITKPAEVGKWEVVRRLRYGALLKLFRHRYGHEFPDDDAGRDDLFVLLCVVSLAPSATDKKIAHTIEMWAPWMSGWEAAEYVEHIGRLNIYERMPSAKILGKRLNLTNAERERLQLWPIAPMDVTVEQLMEQRKIKRREQQRQRRRERGMRPRENSRPWEAEGIARSTYYYRKQRWTRVKPVETRMKPTIVIRQLHRSPTSLQAESQKGLQGRGASKSQTGTAKARKVERLKPSGSPHVASQESNDPRLTALNNWGENAKRRVEKNSTVSLKKDFSAFDAFYHHPLPWCPLEALPRDLPLAGKLAA